MRDRAIAPAPSHSAEDYRWLTGPVAAAVLTRAAEYEGTLAAQAGRLRKELSSQRTALVLEQIELRRRGAEKFSAASRMFFTRKGLEQATDEVLAAYKAARLAGRRVFDLCAGIGGDLISLANVCETVGVDRDPACVILAAANARAVVDSARQPEVRLGDAVAIDVAQCDAWHIDPDRRPHQRRTTRVAAHEPSAEAIDALLARNPHAAVKLAPAAEWPERWTAHAEWEWIGRARQCRQLVAWFGSLAANPGRRRATILGTSAQPLRTLVGLPDQHVPAAARIERFLFEPDAAVLAARLDAALAAEHGLTAITAGVAYWTGPSAIVDPMLSAFEVEEVLPLDLKRVKALLAARKIGRLEIKVRSVDQNPAELRRRLRPLGDQAATLLVTRLSKRVTAILAKRV